MTSKCGYPAEALTIFQRPIGHVQSYVVVCRCGWESQHTTNWRRSLDSHIYRSFKKQDAA